MNGAGTHHRCCRTRYRKHRTYFQWRDLSTYDLRRLAPCLTWLHANPDSRKWERGAPVEGVDGKWIGTHRRLPLTISKELKRNRDEFGVYLPTHAHRKSVLRRFRPKRRKIDANPRLRTVVWAMVKVKRPGFSSYLS
ncbi:DUF3322 domain-containing protein [Corynebacterium tuberculostearicum]|uniref:DUF3322 domain-containing protein n=2 Tax=Corynebacterium tuberculostearicum TaxID=38304 RepID=UPI0038D2567F